MVAFGAYIPPPKTVWKRGEGGGGGGGGGGGRDIDSSEKVGFLATESLHRLNLIVWRGILCLETHFSHIKKNFLLQMYVQDLLQTTGIFFGFCHYYYY